MDELTPWADYTLSVPDPGKARDLDETRRLLYMSLFVSKTDRFVLAGTLVNALAHHGAGIDQQESGPRILDAIDGQPAGVSWVTAQIERITALLAEG